jgi:hypothetical protein
MRNHGFRKKEVQLCRLSVPIDLATSTDRICGDADLVGVNVTSRSTLASWDQSTPEPVRTKGEAEPNGPAFPCFRLGHIFLRERSLRSAYRG